MDFGEDVFKLAKGFPKEELYSLTSQMRRAVDSVALNVAEGATGQTPPEDRKFIGYSMRSLAEVTTCLHKAKRRRYITEDEFGRSYLEAFNLMNMIALFRSKLKYPLMTRHEPSFGLPTSCFQLCLITYRK